MWFNYQRNKYLSKGTKFNVVEIYCHYKSECQWIWVHKIQKFQFHKFYGLKLIETCAGIEHNICSKRNTSNSNFLCFSCKFSCFAINALYCCSRTSSWVIFRLTFLFGVSAIGWTVTCFWQSLSGANTPSCNSSERSWFVSNCIAASVGKTASGPKKKQVNRYFTVPSTCASLALLQPSIMYRQLIPLRQISFGDFYQKTMNFHAGETANIIMGNMLFPREDC